MAKHLKKVAAAKHYRSPGERELLIKHRLELARMLDRLADAELQQGHSYHAERLSHEASAMREMAQ